MQAPTLPQIKQAYYFLKNHFYYDSIDLFAKQQIAAYEAAHVFAEPDQFFERLRQDVLERITLHNFEISFHALPKEMAEPMRAPSRVEGAFFHNRPEQERYEVASVNFFIRADIPTRVLDVLWILAVGSQLDKTLGKCVYANRLLYSVREHPHATPFQQVPLFKKYMVQYASWREHAFDKARYLLKQGKNCLVLFMDIRHCFYSITIDWARLEAAYGPHAYTTALQAVHQQYTRQVKPFLPATAASSILPIGLLSSSVLANWYLKQLDDAITQTDRVAFYGRYVDDILLVKPVETLSAQELSLEHCFRCCVPPALFTQVYQGGQLVYAFTADPRLQIQHKKLLVHYFDCRHCTAGLQAFEQEISRYNSLARFLPTAKHTLRLNDIAYELACYDTRYNLRHMLRFKNSVTDLSAYLTGQIWLHKQVKKHKRRKDMLTGLEHFFAGKNFLDFNRFWLKLFYLLVLLNCPQQIENFYTAIRHIITRLYFPQTELDHQLKQDVHLLLRLSLALPLALNPGLYGRRFLAKELTHFKESNLFENSYVALPLVNFTRSHHSFSTLCTGNTPPLDLYKVALSPRFIHLDEFILFKAREHLHAGTAIDYPALLREFQTLQHISYTPNIQFSGNISTPQIFLQDTVCSNSRVRNYLVKDFAKTVRMGLTGGGCWQALTRRNDWERQNHLHETINQAARERVNLLLFSEPSFPPQWLPMLVQYSRRTQMAFVFSIKIQAGNSPRTYIVTTLPFIFQRYKTVLPIFQWQDSTPVWTFHWHHFTFRVCSTGQLGGLAHTAGLPAPRLLAYYAMPTELLSASPLEVGSVPGDYIAYVNAAQYGALWRRMGQKLEPLACLRSTQYTPLVVEKLVPPRN